MGGWLKEEETQEKERK